MSAGLGFMLLVIVCCIASAHDLDPRLADFEIDKLVRFKTVQEAEALRNKLVRFIWPDGLPKTRPVVSKVSSDCPELASVDGSLLDHIEKYDVNISKFDFHSLVFVAFPKTPAEKPVRLSIVFAGHRPEGAKNYLGSGLSDTVDALLREGFVVAVMQMPLVGWNRDTDGVLPSKNSFNLKTRGSKGHDDLFALLEPRLKGGVFRLFLEPIAQTVNELFAKYPNRPKGLLMIGLSGGGWTTHMAAAVDPRIDISVPVAGSLPLYARPFSPGSKGDTEQWYAPLFGEIDSDGDGVLDKAEGVCTWLEIYALGGLSPRADHPRQQIQVLNLYDSCCFGGPVCKTYAGKLAKLVDGLKTGSWRLYSDKSHRKHMISPKTIETVLIPAIQKSPIFLET